MKIKYVYWQEDDFWIGYLENYPDYMTQGKTPEELKQNLKDIFMNLPDIDKEKQNQSCNPF